MSAPPKYNTTPDFLTHFEDMKDPRQEAKILYPLDEILLLVLCAVISGAQSWTSIALYGEKKLDLLRRFLPFEEGTPSHDQLGILFARLDLEAFQRCFMAWIASLNETLEGVVAVDGKTLRRSFDTGSNKSAIHMISAWACDQQLVLGQRKVDDKSNEITALPELLALLTIKGVIVTIDAMGCQRRICQQIIDQEADYVIGLKGNQGSLREDVELFFDEHLERGIGGEFIKESETVDGDHGRIEMRHYTVCSDTEWLTDRHHTHVKSGETPKRSGNFTSHRSLMVLRTCRDISAITGKWRTVSIGCWTLPSGRITAGSELEMLRQILPQSPMRR